MRTFKKTYIEITNACNLNCSFCAGTKRAREFMTPALFELILKKIKGHSEYIYFHVMGEPLLHPKLELFMDMAKEHGYRVNLTTNGTQNEKLRHIANKEALRQVNLSLHSGESEDYFKGALELASELDKAGKLVSLRLWNLGAGRDNTKVLKMIKEKFGADIEPCNIPTHVRGIKISDNVFLNMAEEFEWPSLSAPFVSDTGFCYGLRDQIGILVDGTVVPCCLDAEGTIALGNIKDSSLEEIVTGSRAKEMYDAFSGRKVREELCKRCGYRTRFK